MRNSIKWATATILATLGVLANEARAHDTVVRWPHEGRLWYGGTNAAEVIMLWHKAPGAAFTGPDKYLEMDVQIPAGYVKSCTTWTDLPAPYDDCGTGGVLDPVYQSYGYGSYSTNLIAANRWYTARYSITRGTSASTPNVVKFGWQETKKAPWCSYLFSEPWCLTGHVGGRVHTGTFWRQNVISKSSWVTPVGTVAPRDLSCDYWFDPGCGGT